MEKKYISTRNQQKEINFYQAIVQGIGEDGGLLVPDFDFTKMDLDVLSKLNYVDLARLVMFMLLNYSMDKRQHSRIWHYRYYLI